MWTPTKITPGFDLTPTSPATPVRFNLPNLSDGGPRYWISQDVNVIYYRRSLDGPGLWGVLKWFCACRSIGINTNHGLAALQLFVDPGSSKLFVHYHVHSEVRQALSRRIDKAALNYLGRELLDARGDFRGILAPSGPVQRQRYRHIQV